MGEVFNLQFHNHGLLSVFHAAQLATFLSPHVPRNGYPCTGVLGTGSAGILPTAGCLHRSVILTGAVVFCYNTCASGDAVKIPTSLYQREHVD